MLRGIELLCSVGFALQQSCLNRGIRFTDAVIFPRFMGFTMSVRGSTGMLMPGGTVPMYLII